MDLLKALHFGDKLYMIDPHDLTRVIDLGEAALGADGTLQFYNSEYSSWHGMENINRWFSEGFEFSLYFFDTHNRSYLRHSTAPDNPSIAVRPTLTPDFSSETCTTKKQQKWYFDYPVVLLGTVAGLPAGWTGVLLGTGVGVLTTHFDPAGAMEGDWTLHHTYEIAPGEFMYEVTVVRNREIISVTKGSYINDLRTP